MRLAWMVSLLLGVAHGAANIDADGFAFDGHTTYCQARTTEQGTLEFATLTPASGGKCPVDIAMTATVRLVSPDATTVDIAWIAQTNAKGSLFPSAMDASTGLPTQVTETVLQACRVGSNCATPDDVVSAVKTPEMLGPFDPNGVKVLASAVLTLPSQHAYVIVAKITLESAPAPVQFVVFERVADGQVVDAGASGERMESNTNTTTSTSSGVSSSSATEPPTSASSTSTKPVRSASVAPALQVDAQDDKDGALGASTASSSSQTSKTSVVVLGAIAAFAMVVAVVYFVGVQRSKTEDEHDDDHVAPPASRDQSCDSMDSADAAWGTEPLSKPALERLQEVERETKVLPPPGTAAYSTYDCDARPSEYSHDDGSSDSIGSIGSYLTSMNSLHDSRVAMPPVLNRKSSSGEYSVNPLAEEEEEEEDDLGVESLRRATTEDLSLVMSPSSLPTHDGRMSEITTSVRGYCERESENMLTARTTANLESDFTASVSYDARATSNWV